MWWRENQRFLRESQFRAAGLLWRPYWKDLLNFCMPWLVLIFSPCWAMKSERDRNISGFA